MIAEHEKLVERHGSTVGVCKGYFGGKEVVQKGRVYAQHRKGPGHEERNCEEGEEFGE